MSNSNVPGLAQRLHINRAEKEGKPTNTSWWKQLLIDKKKRDEEEKKKKKKK